MIQPVLSRNGRYVVRRKLSAVQIRIRISLLQVRRELANSARPRLMEQNVQRYNLRRILREI